MRNKSLGLAILIVAMSLATAWAIRGQFGHEQGAAWAGAIGGLALVVVSKRKDWYNKMALIALAAATGWGAGGMISYGQVVGYGRAANFLNAFYGLGMLFVIGALFGVLGGGLVGLVLDSTATRRVKWGNVVAEMTAGGLITYYFLIEQIGFKMTPPRSEAWAIILGAGLAMLWYMAREKRSSAIRVALLSALGGGFGFAFGNFLQILGNVLEIPFNMWNVMEYSIGFFGGSGMAYGVFTSKWPTDENRPANWANKSALLLLVVFVPLIVYRESLTYGHLIKRLGEIAGSGSVAMYSTVFVVAVLFTMALVLLYGLWKLPYAKKDVLRFLVGYLVVYALLSYVVKGLFAGHMILNHHLYLLNIAVLFVLIKVGGYGALPSRGTEVVPSKKWAMAFLIVVILIAILAFIAVNLHGELPGSRNRF